MRLSILVPVYNEKENIKEIIKKIYSSKISIGREVIVVDDCSKDGTREMLPKLSKQYGFKLYFHEVNMGKGGAIKTALSHASGDVVIFQDADLEYDPSDYHNLIQPILDGRADIVLGNRFGNSWKKPRLYDYIHYLGNRFQGAVLSLLYFKNVKDAWTCYKVFKRDLISGMTINGNRFDYEIELISKILKRKSRLINVDIAYHPRTFDEGKKITWKDGVKALIVTLRYRFFDW